MSVRASHPAPSAPPPLPALDGLRVLAVEDHAIGRALLDAMLGGLGAAATLVGTAEEARIAAGRAHFDVVLLDLGLPDLPGDRLALELARLPGTRDAPVIALTGRLRPAVLPAGFVDWVAKPFSTRDLYDRLAAVAPARPGD